MLVRKCAKCGEPVDDPEMIVCVNCNNTPEKQSGPGVDPELFTTEVWQLTRGGLGLVDVVQFLKDQGVESNKAHQAAKAAAQRLTRRDLYRGLAVMAIGASICVGGIIWLIAIQSGDTPAPRKFLTPIVVGGGIFLYGLRLAVT